MALLDFLKNKREKDRALRQKAQGGNEKKSESNVKQLSAESKPATAKPRSEKKFSHIVVRQPHVSEKSSTLSASNKYTFRVHAATNKPEIKRSIEGLYAVDVLGVNIIKIPKKKRRLGRTEGFKKGYTKAIVTIKEGQKIELF